ncbi:hypothetical protein BB559_000207 [Furculomyces boomerangus]|uniref:Uncharacterized protein n=1 Tax=Furculomyces boomerangus TaxID=61424 RepID=A0A2T9Z5Z8_9FUNG|nr:hypothetical protein BB559_000207 [Furculomyces boomerangus]
MTRKKLLIQNLHLKESTYTPIFLSSIPFCYIHNLQTKPPGQSLRKNSNFSISRNSKLKEITNKSNFINPSPNSRNPNLNIPRIFDKDAVLHRDANDLALALENKNLLKLFQIWVKVFNFAPPFKKLSFQKAIISTTATRKTHISRFFEILVTITGSTIDELINSIYNLLIPTTDTTLNYSSFESAQILYFAVKLIDDISYLEKNILEKKIVKIGQINVIKSCFKNLVPLSVSFISSSAEQLIQQFTVLEKLHKNKLTSFQQRLLILGAHYSKNYPLCTLLYKAALQKLEDQSPKHIKGFYWVTGAILQHIALCSQSFCSVIDTSYIITKNMEAGSSLRMADYFWLMSIYGSCGETEMVINTFKESLALSDYSVLEIQCKALFNGIALAYNLENNLFDNISRIGELEQAKASNVAEYCVEQFSNLVNQNSRISPSTLLLFSKALGEMAQEDQLKKILQYCTSNLPKIAKYPLIEYLHMISKQKSHLDSTLYNTYLQQLGDLLEGNSYEYYTFKLNFELDSNGRKSLAGPIQEYNELQKVLNTPHTITLHIKQLYNQHLQTTKNPNLLNSSDNETYGLTLIKHQIEKMISALGNNLDLLLHYSVLSALLSQPQITASLEMESRHPIFGIFNKIVQLDSISDVVETLLKINLYINTKFIESYMRSQLALERINHQKLESWWNDFWMKQMPTANHLSIESEKGSSFEPSRFPLWFSPNSHVVCFFIDAAIRLGYLSIGLQVMDSIHRTISNLQSNQNVLWVRSVCKQRVFNAYFDLLCIIEDGNVDSEQDIRESFKSEHEVIESFNFEERVLNMFELMKVANLSPSPHFFCYVMEKSSEFGQDYIVGLVEHNYRKMEESGIYPRNFMVNYFNKKMNFE